MFYFSLITSTNACKNSLYKAVKQFLDTNERRLIPENEVEIFKKEVLAAIANFNVQHSRCKPLEASWYDSNDGDMHLHLDYGVICSFHLYKSK